ncbi:MAG TPA: ABC transporter permease [Solirubrobacteraceae bacterium]|jgi:ABC-2 type transport system permease protein|nr:ABC transporter permease [Solirubrobacteraceae bacterium]
MSTPVVDVELLGPPIKGPSALGSDWRRFVRLTWALATTDFRLRFFGSALGYLWQLMRPLMLFGVLYAVFSQLGFGSEVEYYAIALLLGIVLFSFLSEATNQSLRSLSARENLVRKIEFPRLAVPMAAVLTSLFNLALNLLPVFVFLVAAGGRPRWSWLQLPLLIGALGLFVLGLSTLLSVLYVRYRDVEPIWDVLLQATFYASPIFYTATFVRDKAGEGVLRAMMCNPFGAIIQQARHALVDPSHESAATAMGGAVWLLVPGGLTVAIAVIAYRVFDRAAPRIAEDL